MANGRDFIFLILQNYRFSYNEPMSVESTTQALCDLALRFGEGDEESMVCDQFPCIHVMNNISITTTVS